jgi:hypothetical protein
MSIARSLKRRVTYWLGYWVGVPLAYLLFRAIALTLRRRPEGAADRFDADVAAGRRCIAAFWHDDSFYLAKEMQRVRKHGDVYIMASPGRDGALMARFLRMAGARVVPGSTTHGGGRALLRMKDAMTARDSAAIAVDGSRRCPRFTVQDGVLLLARRTALPVVPIAVRTRRRWIVGSKDRVEVPYPFSAMTVVYGEPLFVPSDADAPAIEALRRELEARLKTMKGLV